MSNFSKVQTTTTENLTDNAVSPAKTTRMLLRLLRAAQPMSRVEIARRLNVNRSTITDITKPMINSGLLREKAVESSALRVVRRLVCRSPIRKIFSSG
jgi:DNA-binding MarR family transcriptional regulator